MTDRIQRARTSLRCPISSVLRHISDRNSAEMTMFKGSKSEKSLLLRPSSVGNTVSVKFCSDAAMNFLNTVRAGPEETACQMGDRDRAQLCPSRRNSDMCQGHRQSHDARPGIRDAQSPQDHVKCLNSGGLSCQSQVQRINKKNGDPRLILLT